MTPQELDAAADAARHAHHQAHGLPAPAIPWHLLQHSEQERWRGEAARRQRA